MNTQQELILTKQVDGITFTLRANDKKMYHIAASDGTFVNGKGAAHSTGNSINQPLVTSFEAWLTRSEIDRLGTYKTYHNGKDISVIVFGKWIDRNGRELILHDSSDIYYYFNRPDCGIAQLNNIHGEHYRTAFHYKPGQIKGRGVDASEKLEVLSK